MPARAVRLWDALFVFDRLPEMATTIRIRSSVILAWALCGGAIGGAQTPSPSDVRNTVAAYERANDVAIVRELAGFLTIPNIASDSVNIRRNAQSVLALLAQRGIEGQLLQSPAGGPPAVFGELRVPGPRRTVVLYAHYDGQPVDTTQWLTSPWAGVLRDRLHTDGGKIIPIPATPGTVNGEWRLYGRSAGDDKAPIIAMLRALDALRAANVQPTVNLKFFFEGEEEAGSPHLRPVLVKYADLLRADLWLFGDGPVHQSRRQQIVYGVRGVAGVDLTVYGPSRGLHSGHYGNWAYNPITLLANFIATLRNDDGRILVRGFYDDVVPISPAERRAISAIPPVDSALRAELNIGGTEAGGALLAERIMEPALNLRGFKGGAVGAAASNTISTQAEASIDFRLVPRQTPERIRQLIERHAAAQGYFVVHAEPTPAERRAHPKVMRMDWEAGYPASRVAMDSPVGRAVLQSVESVLGTPVIAMPTLGGSLPMSTFDDVLKTPVIVLPIVNHDNNQHAANENLRLENLFDGILVYAGIMTQLARSWGPITP
jgi:acetylornithine deacetylase/succinyl-diaminopimelate desuccinylase-like protein